MSPEQFRAALLKTLDDRRLSRTERRALGDALEPYVSSPAAQGVLQGVAFEVAREALVSDGLMPRDVFDWLEEVVKVLHPPQEKAVAEAVARFSPGEDCRREICSQLSRARRSADVCVFTITDNEITDAILSAHRRRIRVRIIADDDKSLDRGSDIERLAGAGIETRLDRSPHHMHHKFAVFDGQIVLTGSYNWTRSAAMDNEENLVVLGDAGLVDSFQRVFDKLWEQFG